MNTRIMTLVSALMFIILSATTNSALAKEGDRFWDAGNVQNGVVLKAKYKESPDNLLVDQTLEASIDNAPPGVQLNVYINGFKIGTMVTNGFGNGTFRMAKLGLVPGADGRPTGKRINDGDVISIGVGARSISGTFLERP